MAVFTLSSCFVGFGTSWTGTAPGNPGTQTVSGTLTSTDVSTMVTSVDLSLSADEIDLTNFGSGGWRSKTSGLKAGTLQVTFNQDFAASQVDALFGLGGSLVPFGGTGTYYFEIKPTSASRGSTNPSLVGQVYNNSYSPLTGSVGALAVVQIPFIITGQVARLTS